MSKNARKRFNRRKQQLFRQKEKARRVELVMQAARGGPRAIFSEQGRCLMAVKPVALITSGAAFLSGKGLALCEPHILWVRLGIINIIC